MKTKNSILLLALVLGGLAGCQKVNQKRVYTANAPIYLSYEELRNSVKNVNDYDLQNPGKIYLYNQYILINDFERGIHFYNNSNPSAPQHVAFVSIPGNVDIAVKDDILYADSYVDIVALDISDPKNVKEVGRSMDALSFTVPSNMNWEYPVANIDPSKGVVIGYEVREVEEVCINDECGHRYSNQVMADRGSWEGDMMSESGSPVSFAGAGSANNTRSVATSPTTNISGSMARFMMLGDYLYAISDQSTVKVFDVRTSSLNNVTSFKPYQDAQMGEWGQMIETLFAFKDRLFIGSNSGMLCYNVENPSSPEFLSNYDHMTACDPVVANDDYAFVTLRGGNECGMNADDQMDVLDISDIMNPYEITTVSMSNPYGLAIDNTNNVLFVCDGWDGLKAYNVNDVYNIQLLSHESGETFDVILHMNRAHVIGNEGLVQYSYDAEGKVTKLSTISLN